MAGKYPHRPIEIGGGTPGLGIGQAKRMSLDLARPSLRRHGLSNLGEIGDIAAGCPVTRCFQQAQDGHVDAMAFTRGAHDGLHLLPPGNLYGKRRQRADHSAIGCHQHQPCCARRHRCLFLAFHVCAPSPLVCP